MRKSANMIDESAVRLIRGIENIEVFLEENDQWQFHDSNIKTIHWDDLERRLDVTICRTFCIGIDYDHKYMEPRLDFHFTGFLLSYFPEKCVENQLWKIEWKIELSQDIVKYDRNLVYRRIKSLH